MPHDILASQVGYNIRSNIREAYIICKADIKYANYNCCTYLKKSKLNILSSKKLEILIRDELLVHGIITRNYPIIEFLGTIYPLMEKRCNKFFLNPSAFTFEEFLQSKIQLNSIR